MWLKMLLLLLSSAASLPAQSGDKKREKQDPLPAYLKAPPAPAFSPKEALQSFRLMEGFKLELVASEPMIEDPVGITFDQDGRIWVVQMRSFMPTIDGKGEDAASGRVSVLEDTNADGLPDRSSVFLDHLVLPRAIAVVEGGLLVAEASKLWFARDTDGDGKADQITLVDPDYVVGGNVEHQPNGLLHGLDNWIYNAKSDYRYRLINGRWIKQKTEFRGQWGISQDNYGRLFYNVNDSQLRGDLAPPNYMGRNAHYKSATGLNVAISTNQHLFPIRMNTGVNRGYRPGILDSEGKLREFTAACGLVIYRGNNLPADCEDNAFVCEPGANLIKRNLIFDSGLSLASKQAYTHSEFLASTDERFRPVNAYTGPDGTLYIVDMYRGILQHRAYMTTHLRQEILARDLDKPIHLGRIYRVVNAQTTPASLPKMSATNSRQLVGYLSHANGWCRDTAQRLLVERRDESVVPMLLEMASADTNHLARIHALWTLEGLFFNPPATTPPGALPESKSSPAAESVATLPLTVLPYSIGDRALLRNYSIKEDAFRALLPTLNDTHPKVQIAAVRVLELMATWNKKYRGLVLDRLTKLSNRSNSEVQFQIALSLGNLIEPRALAILADLIGQHVDTALFRDAVMSSLQDRELEFLKILLADRAWAAMRPGAGMMLQCLADAIVKGRDPEKVETLLELTAHQNGALVWRQRALLAGISINAKSGRFEPIVLKTRPRALEVLASSAEASVFNSAQEVEKLLEWPGHQLARAIAEKGKPLTDEETSLFKIGKEQFLVACAPCHGADGQGITPLAPPLTNSEWVLGPPARLIRIVLHGLEAPIHVNGTKYEPPLALANMPSLVLQNQQIAAILTYIRREWGHQAEPIDPATVTKIGQQTVERQIPFTESELLEIK